MRCLTRSLNIQWQALNFIIFIGRYRRFSNNSYTQDLHLLKWLYHLDIFYIITKDLQSLWQYLASWSLHPPMWKSKYYQLGGARVDVWWCSDDIPGNSLGSARVQLEKLENINHGRPFLFGYCDTIAFMISLENITSQKAWGCKSLSLAASWFTVLGVSPE